jgi:putative NADPH-quinone reductase
MKRILILYGNPVKDAFSIALKDAYKEGAIRSKAEVREIILQDLSFELNLRAGYQAFQDLEPDLVKAQEWIKWADHLVFIYPNWWSTLPALLKGFIDRTFLPGFAFRYRKDNRSWDKLLKGKSARLIVTMDNTRLYYFRFLHSPGHHAMKRGILKFCGISPVRTTTISQVKYSSPQQRMKWIMKMEQLGEKMT